MVFVANYFQLRALEITKSDADINITEYYIYNPQLDAIKGTDFENSLHGFGQ